MKDLSCLDWENLKASIEMVAKGTVRVEGEYFKVYSVGPIMRIDLQLPSVGPFGEEVPF